MAYFQNIDNHMRRKQPGAPDAGAPPPAQPGAPKPHGSGGGLRQPSTSTGGAPATPTAPATTTAVAPPQAPSQAASNSGNQGTGFVNLQRYYDLNAPAAQGMANKLTSGIQTEGTAVKQGLGALTTGAMGAVAAATPHYNPASTADVTYAGPKSLYDYNQQGYNDLYGRSQQVQENANALGTQSGREALLQGQYGNSGYTQGEQGLDSFLSGQAGAPQFANTQQTFGNLSKAFGDADAAVAKGANAAKDRADFYNSANATARANPVTPTPAPLPTQGLTVGVDEAPAPPRLRTNRFGTFYA